MKPMRLIVTSAIALSLVAFAGCTVIVRGNPDQELINQHVKARFEQSEANLNSTAVQLHRRLCAVEGEHAGPGCKQ